MTYVSFKPIAQDTHHLQKQKSCLLFLRKKKSKTVNLRDALMPRRCWYCVMDFRHLCNTNYTTNTCKLSRIPNQNHRLTSSSGSVIPILFFFHIFLWFHRIWASLGTVLSFAYHMEVMIGYYLGTESKVSKNIRIISRLLVYLLTLTEWNWLQRIL